MTDEHPDEHPDENAPRRMISIEEVLALVPVDRTTIYRLERRNRFPRGRVISGRRKMYFADEVAAWQRNLLKTGMRGVA